MIYPTITDYIYAVQVSESFRNKSFLRPVLDTNNQPIFIAGGPAVVFKMYDVNHPKNFYALKLFTQEVENRGRNFVEINKYIITNPSEYLIDCEYIPEEIWVNENEYPILLMKWIEGETLSSYIKKQCEKNDTKELEELAGKFDAMALWLLDEQLSHGDLKPDNILVTPSKDLKLVDYDGMYVPGLSGTNSLELGTAEYRHPKRTIKDFNSNLDDFPILVLSLSLHTLSKNPSIYLKQKGGDALLFRSQDYKQILSFPHFQYFQENQEDEILFPRFAMLQYSITQPILKLIGLKEQIEATAIIEDLSTYAKPEDGEWIDEFGVKYSANKKKLIEGNIELESYSILEGCKVICKWRFGDIFGYFRIKHIEIPNSVTSIGSFAFSKCTSLKSIEIPNSVTSIGEYAFEGCRSLESIELPNLVTSIGNLAFYGCERLKSIEIPNSVTSIGEYAFSGCTSLESIEIPNLVTNIGDSAFLGCTSLESIEIPNSVTSVGRGAFSGCTSLENIDIPNAVTSIGEGVFGGCKNLSEIRNYSINYRLEDGFFISKNNILIACLKRHEKQINIPNSVTSIGRRAFSYCTSLESIVILNSVTSIGNIAFSGCTSLKSIDIPNSVTSIGHWTFGGCTSLESIEIPNSVTSIGESAFNGCTSLESIEIANSVTSIGYNAFKRCTSLKSIEIPNSVTSIGEYAFSGCTSLKSIDIPNSVTSIGEYAFEGCRSLESIDLPNSVTSIDRNTFSDCTSLKTIKIPNSVTSIEYSAFSDCTSLETIKIPNSITSIVSCAFSGSYNLSIIVNRDNPYLKKHNGENILSYDENRLTDVKIIIKDNN